jgi:hypothetical protein
MVLEVAVVVAAAVEALVRFSTMRGERGGNRYCRDSGAATGGATLCAGNGGTSGRVFVVRRAAR